MPGRTCWGGTWRNGDSFRRRRVSRCGGWRARARLWRNRPRNRTRTMPEGDTIFRAARTLHRALAGQVVTQFETQLPQLSRVDYDTPVAGRTVERVDAAGKW